MKYFIILILLLPCNVHAQYQADTAQANEYLLKGLSFAKKASYDSSLYYYSQAESISKRVDYKLGLVGCFYGYGLIEHFKRNLEEALQFYLQGLEVVHQIDNQVEPIISKLYNNLGGIYIDLGYRLEARKFLETAIELDNQIHHGPHISIATTNYNMGLINMYFGENQSSLHNFMSAHPQYIKVYGENGSRVAQLYTNIGILHHAIGDFELAEDYFNRAVAIHLENHGETYWNLAYPYTNMGSLYLQTGDKQKALEYYLKALNLCKSNRVQLIRLEGLVNGSLAQYFLDRRDYDKSMNYAEDAIDIIKEAFYDQHPRLNDFYRTIAEIYVKQGDYVTANMWFDKATQLVIQSYGEIHPKISTVHFKQSEVYLKSKDYQKALVSIQTAINTLSPVFDSNDPTNNPQHQEVLDENFFISLLAHKGTVFQELASVEEPQKNLQLALKQYQETALLIDHIRRGFLSESAKLFLQENAAKIYEKALKACYDLYDMTLSREYLDQALYFMEKSKSSVLSEALQASEVTAINGVESNILEKEAELTRYVKSLELKLADMEIGESDSAQNMLKTDLFHAKARVDSLEDAIRTDNPNYHHLKYNMEVVTAEEVQESLDAKSLVISFFEGDSTWYLLSLGKEHIDLTRVLKSDLLPEELEQFRTIVSDQESLLSDYYPQALKIYESLLKPIIGQHSGTDRIIIVPDGLLSYVPFDALITKSMDEKKGKPAYLIQDYNISYRNSLTLYAKNNQRTTSYQAIYVGFAPEYPGNFTASLDETTYRDQFSALSGTLEEVKFASEIFNGEKFLDTAATEYNFKNLPYSTNILHLAMHALVDDKDPMKSRLIFSQEPDSMEDGSLNAYEIYQLSLSAELAVLSACNTGTGKINRGEGVLSISRAFMYAGCPNIVMSLWRAKDQPSSEIMSMFFRNLKDGKPKDQALRQAKLAYLREADPFKAHPANWATFVLLGDNKPLSTPANPLVWLILGGLALVLGILYYKKRKKKLRS